LKDKGNLKNGSLSGTAQHVFVPDEKWEKSAITPIRDGEERENSRKPGIAVFRKLMSVFP
jgi:hypothetical protein